MKSNRLTHKACIGLIIIIINFVIISNVFATTYYVDATGGDNTKDGLSPSTAWKTLGKVRSMSFSPGDSILFERGEVWRGEYLIIMDSGVEGNHITLGAYGTGARPIFDGTGVSGQRGILLGSWSQGAYVGYIRIEDLEIKNYPGAGICGAPGGNPGTVGAHHYIIKNVYTHHNTAEGIILFPGNTDKTTSAGEATWRVSGFHYIENCQSDWNGIHGYKLYGKDNTIIDSTASNNGQVYFNGAGLQLPTQGVGTQTVIGGSYYNNGGRGIRIASKLGGATVTNVETYGNGRDGIELTEAVSNVVISNAITHDNAWNGIRLHYTASDVDIIGCTSYGNDESGIRIEGSANDNVEIKNCEIYSNTDEGIMIFNGSLSNITITYNQVYDNGGYGLHGQEVNGLTILNNTFYGNRNGGYDVYFYSTDNVEMKNCILRTLYYGVEDIVSDYNLYYGTPPDVINGNTTLAEYFSATGNAEHSFTGNPLFTSAGNGIFTLTSESPAIDAGTNVGLTEDFAGNTVPSGVSPDIGAYEYLSQTIPTPPAPTIDSVVIAPNNGYAKVGDSVIITVTAGNNEPGLTPSNATINGKQVPLVDQGDGTYVGIYTVAEGDNDATNVEATNITLTGGGGTSAPASSSGSTLIVDAHTPIIVSVTISPNSGLKVGDSVTITVTAMNNESGLIPSNATINGKSVPLTDQGDGTYTGTYIVGADDIQGVNIEATNITLTDAAGNVSEPASSTGPTGELVSWWRFNDDPTDGVYDETGNNPGSSTNWPTYLPTGGPNGDGAYAFNGVDEYVEAEDSPSLALSSQVTITAWIYPYLTSSWSRIVAKSHTSDANPWTMYGLLFDTANHLRLEIATDGTQNAVNGSTLIPLNDWIFVAGTYDGNSLKVYVNGQLDNSVPHSGKIDTNNMPLSIARSGFNANYFNGIIDEVMIWNRALNDSEILQIYNSQPAPTIDSVVIAPNNGYAKVGDSVIITVTAGNNEAGLTPSNATINGKQVPLVDQGDGTYIGIYTVAEGDNAATNVEAKNITLTGEGGTSAPASSSGSTLIVDAHRPIIASVTISPNSGWLKVGDGVTITVTAMNNESGFTPSNATINGKSIPLTDQGDGTYTGTYTVGADDNQSINIEATNITLTDAAGNVSEPASSTGSTLKYLKIETGGIKVQGGRNGYVNPSDGEEAKIYFKASSKGKLNIKIYTLRGQLVWKDSKETDGSEDYINWACENSEGSIVSSGVYIIYIEGPGIKTKKKVAVLR